jgi:hypothetical protein
VVDTTANYLNSCGQRFETAPAVNRWKRYSGRCCSSHPGKTVFFVLDEQLYTRRPAPFFLRQSSHTP